MCNVDSVEEAVKLVYIDYGRRTERWPNNYGSVVVARGSWDIAKE